LDGLIFFFNYNITRPPFFSENFDHMTKSLLLGVILPKATNFESNMFKVFRKKRRSSYIHLNKFPNEQFKQTFGTTSQNGLKVSLFIVALF
jgi:hypothetical protein